MWWHLEQGARPIAPGLRYGAQPSGTKTTVPAAKLPSGTVQTLWLYGEGREPVASYSWRT
jgi:hypothetical protein